MQNLTVHSELFKNSTAISEEAFISILRDHNYSYAQINQLIEKFQEGQIIIITQQADAEQASGEKEGAINEL